MVLRVRIKNWISIENKREDRTQTALSKSLELCQAPPVRVTGRSKRKWEWEWDSCDGGGGQNGTQSEKAVGSNNNNNNKVSRMEMKNWNHPLYHLTYASYAIVQHVCAVYHVYVL